MCGLVGVLGAINKAEKYAFRFMLLVDQIRGFHSTGITKVNTDGTQISLKKALHSTDFLDLKSTDKMIDAFNTKALMGHNRWATKGAVNNSNAHPFTCGTISGMHNGTLRQQNLLDDHKDFEVDSENIFHCIDKNGVEDTVSKLSGAFALVWHDSKDDTLNMIRNSERPLYYAYKTDGKGIMWASESWMLMVAANKSNIKIHKPVELPVGKLFTFKLKDYNEFRDKVSSLATLKNVTLYKAPVSNINNKAGNYKGYNTYGNKKRVQFLLDAVKKPFSTGSRNDYFGVSECGFDVCVSTYTEDQSLKVGVVYEGRVLREEYVAGVKTYVVNHWEIEEVPENKVGKSLKGF